jgi:xanthine dehydrogenase accessory factor
LTGDHGHDGHDHGHDHGHGQPHVHDDGSECAVAHGDADRPAARDATLVAVYATGFSRYLLDWGRELGFRTVLLEPDPAQVSDGHRAAADAVLHDPGEVTIDADTDVVITDHHRDDIGPMMAPLVTARPRWIGIMGSPRHEGPHTAALAAQGVDPALIATVHRPVGLDIGSKLPAEIALSTLAGLLADRNGRSGAAHRSAATPA